MGVVFETVVDSSVLLVDHELEVAEVSYEGEGLPAEEELYLHRGEAHGKEDDTGADSDGVEPPTTEIVGVFDGVQAEYGAGSLSDDGLDFRGREISRGVGVVAVDGNGYVITFAADAEEALDNAEPKENAVEARAGGGEKTLFAVVTVLLGAVLDLDSAEESGIHFCGFQYGNGTAVGCHELDVAQGEGPGIVERVGIERLEDGTAGVLDPFTGAETGMEADAEPFGGGFEKTVGVILEAAGREEFPHLGVEGFTAVGHEFPPFDFIKNSFDRRGKALRNGVVFPRVGAEDAGEDGGHGAEVIAKCFCL